MAFSGGLIDYPLAELLFYLSSSHRSGWLTIRSDTAEVTFTLFQGRLVAARSHDLQYCLGQRLVADGTITVEQLDTALQVQTRSQPPVALGSALVTLGYVPMARIQHVLRDQAIDLIFQILIRPQCAFTFDRGLPDIQGIEVDIPMQRDVLEAIRRADEWSSQQLWTAALCLNPETSADMLVGVIANDWPTIDALMNGAANLDEVVAETGWPPGAALESLRRLQSLEIIFIDPRPRQEGCGRQSLTMSHLSPGAHVMAPP